MPAKRRTSGKIVQDVNYRKTLLRPRRASTHTRSVLLELFAASIRTNRLMRKAFDGAPLTPDEFGVYSLLGYIGPITPAKLAEALGMQRSTLSNYLTRMDERKDLDRATDPADGRASLVRLSDAGRARSLATQRFFARAVEPFRDAMGPTKWVAAIRSLSSVNEALEIAIRKIDAEE
jgi:DNA-binding MarR family transcriptional regulator